MFKINASPFWKPRLLTIYASLLVALCLVSSGCSEDEELSPEEQLPPITQTGENTFGCLINGELFMPTDGRGASFGPRDPGILIWSIDGVHTEFDVHDFQGNPPSDLLIHLENVKIQGEGEYIINSSNGQRGIDGNQNTFVHGTFWDNEKDSFVKYVSYDNSGLAMVTRRDFVINEYNIYSGTFDCQLVDALTRQDTLIISLGRFDLEAYSLNYTRFP
jgi:hypothetical protein